MQGIETLNGLTTSAKCFFYSLNIRLHTSRLLADTDRDPVYVRVSYRWGLSPQEGGITRPKGQLFLTEPIQR